MPPSLIQYLKSLNRAHFVQVDVQLTRSTGKVAPLVGPQGHGVIPTLTEVRALAVNHEPDANCASVYVSATDDATGSGGVGGTYANSAAGACTQGPPIDINSGSLDSDTQEGDALITTGTTVGNTIVRFFVTPFCQMGTLARVCCSSRRQYNTYWFNNYTRKFNYVFIRVPTSLHLLLDLKYCPVL